MDNKLEIKEIKYLVVEDPEDGRFSIWITVAPFSGEKDCTEFIKKKDPSFTNEKESGIIIMFIGDLKVKVLNSSGFEELVPIKTGS